ncbi:hypothetical protein ACFWFZ_26330 [Streptomyces sp. NPDC060232]|uniref:hypothetical protein n=1 Tax=Streptomyces sp. NPDC060232 TaxID=3347079 RepID=UPI00365B8660
MAQRGAPCRRSGSLVAAYEPPELLDMVSVAGPMPMRVTFGPLPDGGTLARIRVRGDASGMYRLAGPVMGRKVRSSLVKDLQDLERQVSRRTRG